MGARAPTVGPVIRRLGAQTSVGSAIPDDIRQPRNFSLVPACARIGVDIGGTFTDLVLVQDGRVRATAKTLTTAKDPSQGVAAGIEKLLERVSPGTVTEVVHGTTLVANALIERGGAKTALLTTKGFKDVLAIRREHRYDIYDLFIELPEPLVPRRRRWELDERILAGGEIDAALDQAGVERLARRAKREGVEAIAISLLHAYRNPDHERQAKAILQARLPATPISVSSEVAPELGEYVRTSTTVANAYVQPLVDRYLQRIADRLREQGIEAPLHVMLSTGGLADVDTGRRFPIRLAESGPAAGAISAAWSGRQAGIESVLAFDMGGTTAKACLVEKGEPLIAREHEVARVYRFARESGLPVRAPVVDLIEIGAGGGSIARVDRFGLPKVGPESAAADPGPACYGLGGEEATVTDADLLLGHIDPDRFLGGEMALDVKAAEKAMARFAKQLGATRQEAAAAIHRVVDENMAAAARMHAIERGRDLRRFALVATGGAGPVHAAGVARLLGIETIVFPPSPGVASAFGMLTAPPAYDFARSLPAALSEVDWEQVGQVLEELKEEGRRSLPAGRARFTIQVDARHQGQGDSLTVTAQPNASAVGRAFTRAYVDLYGRTPPGVPIEILTWRLRASGKAPSLTTGRERGEEYSNVVIPRGASLRSDGHGNLVMTL